MSSASTVTFPHTSTSQNAAFFPAEFDIGTSGFTMNPLSSHPPRTPKPSLVPASDLYNATEEGAEKPVHYETREEPSKKAAANVRSEEVWRDILKSSTGRDKAFKIIQYSLKIYILFHSTLSSLGPLRRSKRPPWEAETIKRLDALASGLSLSRKSLILFNWLTPLATITAPSNVPFAGSQRGKSKPQPFMHKLLHAPPPVLLDLANGFSDDIYVFHRLGLFGPKLGARAARVSDYLWFTGTLVNLVEVSVERSMLQTLMDEVQSRQYAESMTGVTANAQSAASKTEARELEKLRTQDYWLQVSRLKLLMDLIFVSYDVFRFKRAKNVMQTFSGLASALLSIAKLYDRQYLVLAKEKS